MLQISVLIIIALLMVVLNQRQETVVNATEEEFERRFYEAVWNIDASNHSWVEKAFRKYKAGSDSYWNNIDAIAMLELLEANDSDIRSLVVNLCKC